MGRLTGIASVVLVIAACGRTGTRTPPVAVGRGEVAESTLAWPIPENVEVEVRNAAGTSGLARTAARTLRSKGFDVVTYGSHDGESDTTLVLLRRGAVDQAERVRTALGQGLVRERRDTTRRVDVTVILGKDYRAKP